jgi:CheY-like chemotaxis protein
MSKHRLLLIEDDVDVAEMLVTYFSGQGYTVVHSDTGLDGVQQARTQFPHLILLDLMLPDITGFDVCRMLRSTNMTRYIPIIFLTQRDDRADRLEGLEIGADDYVTKPFDIEELRLRIQNSISRATRDNLHEVRTGLPTGDLVRSEYFRTLYEEDGEWRHIGIQIENFDTYRDNYGFIAADDALGIAAQILRTVVGELGTEHDFVGTDAEASFVIYTHSDNPDAITQHIEQTFQQRVEALYSFSDLNDPSRLMTLNITPFSIEA